MRINHAQTATRTVESNSLAITLTGPNLNDSSNINAAWFNPLSINWSCRPETSYASVGRLSCEDELRSAKQMVCGVQSPVADMGVISCGAGVR